jgi:hypothetical protein
LLKGFYIDDKWELVNESEEESLKFNYKINVGRIKSLFKGTNAERAANIMQHNLSSRKMLHEVKVEDYNFAFGDSEKTNKGQTYDSMLTSPIDKTRNVLL